MDWLTNLFKGIGSAAQGAGRSIMGAGQNIGQGLGQMAQKASPMIGNFLQGASKQAPNILQGFQSGGAQPAMKAGLQVGQSATQPQSSNPFQGFQSLFQNLLGGAQGSQKPTGGQNPMQPTSSPAMSSGANTPNWMQGLFSSGSQTQPTQTQVQTPTAQPSKPTGGAMDWLGGLFNPQQGQPNIGQALVGGGMGLAGQMMNTPKIPDISSLGSVNAMRNFDITKNTQNISPELQAAFDRQTALRDSQEEKALYARYANLQPGTSPEESSTFKTDLMNLKNSQADRAAGELAQMYNQNAITQMGLNEQEAQQLQDVAQLDVDQIMNQFGIDYMSAMKLKEMFGNIGGTMMSSAFGAFNPIAEGE